MYNVTHARISINNADKAEIDRLLKFFSRTYPIHRVIESTRKKYTTFREDTLILKIRRWSVDF